MPDRSTPTHDDDLVVLLDDAGHPVGTHPRATVHTTSTPLHQAFSVYLFDGAGRLLLTRRALTKTAWPGVWTNSCCGHPRPGETTEAAMHRRVEEELGCPVQEAHTILPDYRYRAVDASGVVEHEMCPVMIARIDPLTLDPSPDEVCETAWVEWADIERIARRTPSLISPWAAEQVLQLTPHLHAMQVSPAPEGDDA